MAVALDNLADALAATPKPPCEPCPHSRRCAAEELACIPFERYVDGDPCRPQMPRRPSRELYPALFPSSGAA